MSPGGRRGADGRRSVTGSELAREGHDEAQAEDHDAIRPGGYLVLGHSESLGRTGLPLLPVGNTVFRRT